VKQHERISVIFQEKEVHLPKVPDYEEDYKRWTVGHSPLTDTRIMK
jgi:hypothetical protein